MAAVTVAQLRRNTRGAYREHLYKLTVVTTADTLITGLKDIVSVSVSPNSGITGVAESAGTLTFTGTGATLFVSVVGK